MKLIDILKRIQHDKKSMVLSDLIQKYEPFAKLYPPLFQKAITDDFTEEDYGRIMNMMALKYQVNNNIVSLDKADEKIKEKLFQRYYK